MPGIEDARLKNNLGCLIKVTKIAKAIMEKAKEKDKNDNDKRMFSEGTINKYTQQRQTEDREDIESEEEMEIR